MQRDTGASVRIYNLAKGLVSYGNDVHVIIPGEKASLQSVDGIQVHGIRGFCPNAILKVLKKVVSVERSTSLYFYDFAFILRIVRLVQQSDVVQVEQQTAGGMLVPFVKKVLRRPVVVDCHDVFQALRVRHTSFLRRLLETFQEKLSYRCVDLILTVSKQEKSSLASYGIAESKIEVIPNGVDTNFFTNLSKKPSILDQFGLRGYRTVIFVGNNEYFPNREAIQLLSSVIAPLVLKEVGDTKFLIVGKTPESLKLPNLIFTGIVKSVPDFLAVSDVAVAPLYHGTGTRLKIIEYFSCALPVVSTWLGAEGIGVENGTNILIEDDPKQFAARIAELLRDKDLALRLGTAARQLAEEKYDWRAITDKLNTVLGEISCGRPAIVQMCA